MTHITHILLLSLLLLTNCNTFIHAADNPYDLKKRADILYQEQRYVESFDSYTTAMKMASRNNDHILTEMCLGNIGNIFDTFDDYERANYYYHKCYIMAIENNDSDIIAKCLINLVTTSSLMNEPQKAKEFFLLQNRHQMRDIKTRRYFFFQGQAAIALAENNYPLAISLHKQTLQIIKQQKMDAQLLANTYNEIGKCFLRNGQPDSAIVYLKYSCKTCKESSLNKFLADAYKMLSEAYEDKNDKTNKMEYQNLYLALTDSMFSDNQFNIAKDKLYKFEENINDEHINSLNTTIDRAIFIIIVILVFLVALAVLLYIIFRQNRRLRAAYSMLYNKNKELINSHEESQHLREQYAEILDKETYNTVINSQNNNGYNDVDKDIRTVYNNIQTAKLIKDINVVMENTEFISNPDFSISTLASTVGSNVKYVSAIINDTYKVNFKSYLNEFRVREASKRLADRDKYGNMTIKSIAESVGYNSINNFIIAFKKVVGITPSAYQRLAEMQAEEN